MLDRQLLSHFTHEIIKNRVKARLKVIFELLSDNQQFLVLLRKIASKACGQVTLDFCLQLFCPFIKVVEQIIKLHLEILLYLIENCG